MSATETVVVFLVGLFSGALLGGFGVWLGVGR